MVHLLVLERPKTVRRVDFPRSGFRGERGCSRFGAAPSRTTPFFGGLDRLPGPDLGSPRSCGPGKTAGKTMTRSGACDTLSGEIRHCRNG
jgi:hypothetical protein